VHQDNHPQKFSSTLRYTVSQPATRPKKNAAHTSTSGRATPPVRLPRIYLGHEGNCTDSLHKKSKFNSNKGLCHEITARRSSFKMRRSCTASVPPKTGPAQESVSHSAGQPTNRFVGMTWDRSKGVVGLLGRGFVGRDG